MSKDNNSNSKNKSIKKIKYKNNKKSVKHCGGKINSNKKKSNSTKKKIKQKVQKGGNNSCKKPEQPLRPRLYNKAQSSNLLEDYPNAPPFPPDFLDECVIM